MRIAFGCIGHETNTFSPVRTSINSFKKGSYYVGEEIISAFKAKLYFVRMADLSMSRMLIYYMIYVMKSVILNIRSKINKLV